VEYPGNARLSDRARPLDRTADDAPSSGSLGVVLVAEDNRANQLVARGALEGLGYTVDFAQDGLQAVAAVTAAPHRYGAVLMDCQMPRLDGYEATRVIRQLEEPGARVPVIGMAASTVTGERQRCREAGMDDVLLKPVDFEVLEATLTSWITTGAAPETAVDTEPADPWGMLDLARVRMLQDLGPGGSSLFDRFVGTFVDRVQDDVASITGAVEEGDSTRLVANAHMLKGSAQNLGAAALGQVCHWLEEAGRRPDLDEARGLLPLLVERAQLSCRALRAVGP
jgi:two-component system sensor histidine kinase/response regulator